MSVSDFGPGFRAWVGAMAISSIALAVPLLEPFGEGRKVNDVTVPLEAKVSLPGTKETKPTKTLYLTGAGVRTKKVAILKIKAYVAASYTDSKSALPAADPMAGIREHQVKALRLTFLRDISSDKIKSSFRESLASNKVDPDAPAMRKLFENLSFDVKEGTHLDIVGFAKDKAVQTVAFEGPAGRFSVDGAGLADEFWKIWFGNTSEDSGLDSLKKDLAPTAEAAR